LYNFSLGPYSLSVRDNDDQRGPHVKHYKIRCPDPTIGFYIAARRSFKTLEELIDYYTSKIKKSLNFI
jgi:tyrosine-protein kinase Fgr